MLRFRGVLRAVVLSIGLMTSGMGIAPVAAAEPDLDVVAYLDGKLIPIADVANYYCDDFSYPIIQCSRLSLVTQARALLLVRLTGVDYVSVFDLTSYNGGFMNISQDYPTLITVGWNDRVSSYRGRNGETGLFYTDWFYGGTSWGICCNQNVSSLGTYNNTFSSMKRT